MGFASFQFPPSLELFLSGPVTATFRPCNYLGCPRAQRGSMASLLSVFHHFCHFTWELPALSRQLLVCSLGFLGRWKGFRNDKLDSSFLDKMHHFCHFTWEIPVLPWDLFAVALGDSGLAKFQI